jgi:hypothetical protein
MLASYILNSARIHLRLQLIEILSPYNDLAFEPYGPNRIKPNIGDYKRSDPQVEIIPILE